MGVFLCKRVRERDSEIKKNKTWRKTHSVKKLKRKKSDRGNKKKNK